MKTKRNQRKKQELSRRNFLKFILNFLGVAAAVEIGGVSLAYLKSRSDENPTGGLIMAGPIDNFTPGSVTPFNNDGFYLIRDENGDFLAVHQRCPHLGCNVIWQPEQNQFVCPCHASNFDDYGDYESSPVSRPLDTVAVKIEDAYVYVDTSMVNSRERYDPSQMTSPRSQGNSEAANE